VGDRQLKVIVVVAVVAVLIAISAAMGGGSTTAARPSDRRPITKAELDATFTYDASVTPNYRNLIDRAIARARPEAQRLFAIVDGLTTISVGTPANAGALGTTEPQPDGRYHVIFDLDTTYHDLGERGITRLVLHELGHVVDGALIPRSLAAQFDAGIPAGLPCPQGTPIGSCAPQAERFAESFAKWASGDLGVDLYAGYAVPAPLDIEQWGAPLDQLGT
jgi:hypothetical protein